MPWKSGGTSFIHFPPHFHQLPQFGSHFVGSWMGHPWLWRKGFTSSSSTGFVATSWGIPRASTAAWGPSDGKELYPPVRGFPLIWDDSSVTSKLKPEFFNPKFPSSHSERVGPSLLLQDGGELRNFRKGWSMLRIGSCPQTRHPQPGKGRVLPQFSRKITWDQSEFLSATFT